MLIDVFRDYFVNAIKRHIKELECEQGIVYSQLQRTCLFLYLVHIQHVSAAGAIIKIIHYFLCTTN